MNNSTEASILHETDRRDVSALVYTLIILTTAWTIGSNLVILVCFYRNRRREWTEFSRQTCSMTISDLVVGSTVIPFLVIGQQGRRTDTFSCVIPFYVHFSAQNITLLHVLGICIFRNIRIKTISHVVQTSRQFAYSKWVIVISWTVPFVTMLFPFLIWSFGGDNQKLCVFGNLFGFHHKKAMVYIGSFYVVSQSLTNIIYLVTCVRIKLALRTIVPIGNDHVLFTVSIPARTAVRSSSGQHNNTASNRPTGARIDTRQAPPTASIPRNPKQVIVTIGIVLLLFNVFTLPVTVMLFMEMSQPLNYNVWFLGGIMFIVNSGLNPIVYATRITSVREAIRALFRDIISAIHL